MIVYEKMVRICLRKAKSHSKKRPITGWFREEYEEFLMNEMKDEYADRIEDLRVEYSYVKVGDLKWH